MRFQNCEKHSEPSVFPENAHSLQWAQYVQRNKVPVLQFQQSGKWLIVRNCPFEQKSTAVVQQIPVD